MTDTSTHPNRHHTGTQPSTSAWLRSPTALVLFALWLVFCFWQFTEHRHQCRLIETSLSSQAQALSNAVTGSLQSHRWFGPYVQQQLPMTLDVLSRADNVLAVVVQVNEESDQKYSAGNAELVDASLPDGEHVVSGTLQRVHRFEIHNNPPPFHGVLPEDESRPPVEMVRATVVLDRTSTMAQIRREAINRLLIVGLGTLVLIAVGAGWQFTVRLARAEGQTRLLIAEARHLRELGQAAAGLAHETRNPLGLIRGWTQRLVAAGLPGEEQQEQAEAVLEECDRVTARINQFLAFARPTDLVTEAVNVRQLLSELDTLLQSDLDDRGLTLDVRVEDQKLQVLADRNQLRQLLFNLLQNAIAFAPASTAITITVCPSAPGFVRMDVMDRGPGVPDDIADSLFEPYVTRRPGGTGLGLSIVRRIAGAHDWDISYHAAPEGGSLFRIDRVRVVREMNDSA